MGFLLLFEKFVGAEGAGYFGFFVAVGLCFYCLGGFGMRDLS